MAEDVIKPAVNRREFIRAAALSAIVATSAGASAAILVDKRSKTNLDLPSAPNIELPVIERGQNAAELVTQLMSAHVENARLKAQLNAAENRVEIAKKWVSGREDGVGAAVQAQLEESRTENTDLSWQVSVLSGLVALYQQLEAVDLESTISEGISELDQSLDDLVLQLPLVQAGIDVSQKALTDLEAKLPVLESASQWVEEQFESLGGQIGELEMALLGVVKNSGPVAALLADWFSVILKWLPFGLGDKSSSAMESVSQLLTNILKTKDELEKQVVKPIDALVHREENEMALQRSTINPLREKLLDPTTLAVEKASLLKERYQSYLVSPINLALEERRRINGLIVDYQRDKQI